MRHYLGIAGTLPLVGDLLDVAVVNKYAYVPRGNRGFSVIDVSVVASPYVVGSLDMPEQYPWKVVADDHYAYVADPQSVFVVDVSAPEAPAIVGSIAIPDEAREIVLEGTTLWVASGSAGLVAVDVSNPSFPVIQGTLDLPKYAYSVAVESGLVCVGAEHGVLYIVDGSNFTSPKLVKDLYVAGGFAVVALRSGICYVGDYRLSVIDVTNPLNAYVLTHLSLNADVTSLATSGDFTYVETEGIEGVVLHVLDTSNPSSPQRLGTWCTLDGGRGLAISNGAAYLPTGGALNIVDVSNPIPVPLRTSVGLNVGAVAAMGSLAISARYDSLHVLDMSSEPQEILGAISLPEGLPGLHHGGLATAADLAFVAARSAGLQIVDVSDPTAPAIVGEADLPASIVAASGSKVAIAADKDLYLVDVSDPRAPIVRSSLVVPNGVGGLDFEGDLLFVATRGLTIIDVSDPSHPFVLGSIENPDWIDAVAVVGNRAYVGNVWGLGIFDVSNPSAPKLMASLECNQYLWDIAIRGGFAYLGVETTGMIVVDVSNPIAPHLIGGVDTPGYVRSLDIGQNGVYIADGNYSGLRIAPTQCFTTTLSFESMPVDPWGEPPTRTMSLSPESRAHLVPAYPTPFRNQTTLAFALDQAMNVRLTIHDVAGRLVRSILEAELSPGRHQHKWNGRDAGGVDVSPGTYFVRLQAGEQVAVERVTRFR